MVLPFPPPLVNSLEEEEVGLSTTAIPAVAVPVAVPLVVVLPFTSAAAAVPVADPLPPALLVAILRGVGIVDFPPTLSSPSPVFCTAP